jgi:hypothetical protein
MSTFSGDELDAAAKVLATEKPIEMPSIHGEPPDFSRGAMAEAAAYNEAVSGKSNPLGDEHGAEPSLSRQRNRGNTSKAPKGQVDPGEPAPGDDEPEDWEDYFNGTGGPSLSSKRKVKDDIKESILIEAEQAVGEGTLEEFLSDTADVLVEAVNDNRMLAESLEDSRTENERLACQVAFADFTRGCSNFHREKMASFMDDLGTWHMARDFHYLQKVSNAVKEAAGRLRRGLNGYEDPLAKGPEGTGFGVARDTYAPKHDRIDPEVEKVIQAMRNGPLGTSQG